MTVILKHSIHEYNADVIGYSLEQLLTIKNCCGCNLSICVLCKTTFHNNVFRIIYYTRHVDKKYHLQILCYMIEYITNRENYGCIYNRLLNSMYAEIFWQYNNNSVTIDERLRQMIIQIMFKRYIPYLNLNL